MLVSFPFSGFTSLLSKKADRGFSHTIYLLLCIFFSSLNGCNNNNNCNNLYSKRLRHYNDASHERGQQITNK